MRKLTIIFLFLMVNVWFALGWTPPSPITPPDTIPDAVANMNFGILGGNVPAAAPGGCTWGSGDSVLFNFETGGEDDSTIYNTVYRGLKFTTTDAVYITGYQIYMRDITEAGGNFVAVVTPLDGSSFPNEAAPVADSSISVASTSIGTTRAWIDMELTSVASLSGTTTYALVLKSSSADTFQLYYDGDGAQPNSLFSEIWIDASTVGFYYRVIGCTQ